MNEAIKKIAKDICLVKANCNDVCNPADCCQALKYAEKAYEEGYRKQEWISVEERLPPKYKKVLVFSAGVIEVSHLSSTGLWWEVYDSNLVTHWMLLPEAPKMKGGAE